MGSDWLSDRAFFWMRDVLLHSVNSKQPFIEYLLHICWGMLLDILLWTGRPPTTQNHPVQNGSDATSEKHSWSHTGRIHLRQRELCWLLTFALTPLHWQWGPSSHTQSAVTHLESCSLYQPACWACSGIEGCLLQLPTKLVSLPYLLSQGNRLSIAEQKILRSPRNLSSSRSWEVVKENWAHQVRDDFHV